ncbi:choice-of-anchor D domain-containing protein [Geodermatophilus sp. URMC 63]
MIRTSVSVGGDVSGQLAVGSHIVQMRVDTVLGNLVTVLPADARANIRPRPVPVSLVPRRPAFLVGRRQETERAVEALSTQTPVELYGPAGMGKSTLLRSLAHQLPIADACGGMAHLSARGYSHDDLLKVLFDVFYSSDIPVKPSPGELRHLLQDVRAALLLDDVELSDDDIADVEDYAPRCGFVLTTASAPSVGEALAIELTGLRGEAARELVGHALGRSIPAEEQPAIDTLCDLVRGSPAGLLRLAAAARTSDGTLAEFAASAAVSGAPPIPVDSVEDVRLLGLLAAVPGIQLGVGELSAITGAHDVQERVDRLVARGLVSASAPPANSGARTTYGLAEGVELGPPLLWQMEQRREEVRRYFLDLAEQRSDTILAPGAPAEPLRAVHADAARHREWRYVLTLGLLLDAAYSLSGRWDAWREVAEHRLTAARALGDRPAEALALHQLGTRALCVGDTATARDLLRDALDLRRAVGAFAAAEVTQHNLSLVLAPPPPPPDEQHDPQGHGDHDGSAVSGDDGGVVTHQGHSGATAAHSSGAHVGAALPPISAKVLVVCASLIVVPALVAGLVIFGSGGSAAAAVALDHRALSFGTAAVSHASESRTLTARNTGTTPIHLDAFPTSGANHSEFVVTASTCRNREIPAGGSCSADVVFVPTGAGPRAASLTVDVREMTEDPSATLSGTSTEPDGSSMTAEPTELTFGEQPLNEAGDRRLVTVTGPPGGPVVLGTAALSGLDAADFVVEGDDCSGAQLVPGTTCTIGVRFTPGDQGRRQGLLTLPGPEGVPGLAIPLTGTGAEPPSHPAFRVEPRALDFGDQPVSSPSPRQQVVLTNSADVPLDVSTVSVAGSPDFAVTQAACPAALEPGQDCVVEVVFTPVTTGLRAAQLLFGGDGPAVPMSGSGAAPPTAAPDVSPRFLEFSQVLVGDVSPAQAVVVTNRADRPLQLVSSAVTGVAGAFRLDAGQCAGAAVAPGASCSVAVSFAPMAAGEHSGVLLLTAQGFPDTAVALSGVGTRSDTPLVPDVIGLPLAQAQRELAAAGLATGTLEEVEHPDIPAGAVADQSPRPGVPAAAGSPVDLRVSSGPPVVLVPDVVGLSPSEAADRLLSTGLRVGEVSEDPRQGVMVPEVDASHPGAGTGVPAGSAVDLEVVVPLVAAACPTGQEQNADGVCTPTPIMCPSGQERDPATNTCTLPPCPEGQERTGSGPCTTPPVQCTAPQERDPATNTCTLPPCPEGQERTGSGPCTTPPVQCTAPQERDPATNTCTLPPCPEGQERTGSGPCTTPPVQCTAPQERDPATNTCTLPPCPEGQERTGSGPCTTPPVQCTAPQERDPATNTCTLPPCPEGQERTGSGPCTTPPVQCTAPQERDPATNTCTYPPCEIDDQVRNAQGVCTCPNGQVLNESAQECQDVIGLGADAEGLVAVAAPGLPSSDVRRARRPAVRRRREARGTPPDREPRSRTKSCGGNEP